VDNAKVTRPNVLNACPLSDSKPLLEPPPRNAKNATGTVINVTPEKPVPCANLDSYCSMEPVTMPLVQVFALLTPKLDCVNSVITDTEWSMVEWEKLAFLADLPPTDSLIVSTNAAPVENGHSEETVTMKCTRDITHLPNKRERKKPPPQPPDLLPATLKLCSPIYHWLSVLSS